MSYTILVGNPWLALTAEQTMTHCLLYNCDPAGCHAISSWVYPTTTVVSDQGSALMNTHHNSLSWTTRRQIQWLFIIYSVWTDSVCLFSYLCQSLTTVSWQTWQRQCFKHYNKYMFVTHFPLSDDTSITTLKPVLILGDHPHHPSPWQFSLKFICGKHTHKKAECMCVCVSASECVWWVGGGLGRGEWDGW